MSQENPNFAALQAIGLEESKIKDILKNQKITQRLVDTIQKAGVSQCEKKVGNLLYKICTELPESKDERREVLAKYVASGQIDTNTKLEHAIAYIKNLLIDQDLNVNAFEKSAGVGVSYNQEQIKQLIAAFFESKKAELQQLRYICDQTGYLKSIRDEHPFVDGAILKKEFDSQLLEILGPKTEQDRIQFEEHKKKKDKQGSSKRVYEQKDDKKKEQTNSQTAENTQPKEEEQQEEDQRDILKKLVARDLASSLNSEKLLQEHKKATGGRIVTRFPPEPNGYLHIGHAKAMRFNFMTAKENGGYCYLRMDDTNPEKENQEYIDSIKENVQWLGYQPHDLTHASDNFQKLYDYAIFLIKKGKAFVCGQSKAEMSEARTNKTPSPYRDTPIEENLRLFEEMRLGLHPEGSYSLRLKIDYQHPNPTLRDPVAYRIRYTPHPHVGDKWCIYPCYDYTHCLCDSIENITHSLCTLEFEIRRELYYWTLEQCEIYRPYVWEYSRMNVSNYVVSKRKLQLLVAEGHVTGWDDPRMPTIQGLRRKGYTPEAINEFCDILGVTRRGNENFVSYKLLESCIRKDLDRNAPRTMVVLEPIKVIVQDMKEGEVVEISVPNFPKEPERGSHVIRLSRQIYIDRGDVRMDENKDHYGMSPGRVTGLKYAGIVQVNEVKGTIDANGVQHITEVFVTRLPEKSSKPKSYIHWVSQADAVPCEVRLYDVLFNVYDPNQLENFLDGLNPNSLEVKPNAVMSKQLLDFKVLDKTQFERLGFFCVDKDSNIEQQKYVFNRVVTLAEKAEVTQLKENLKKQ